MEKEWYLYHLGEGEWAVSSAGNPVLVSAETMNETGDTAWYIAQLPDGNWGAWESCDWTAHVFPSREEALSWKWWEEATYSPHISEWAAVAERLGIQEVREGWFLTPLPSGEWVVWNFDGSFREEVSSREEALALAEVVSTL